MADIVKTTNQLKMTFHFSVGSKAVNLDEPKEGLAESDITSFQSTVAPLGVFQSSNGSSDLTLITATTVTTARTTLDI